MKATSIAIALFLVCVAAPRASHAGAHFTPAPPTGTYSTSTAKGNFSGNLYDVSHYNDASHLYCSFTRADPYTYVYCEAFVASTGQWYGCAMTNPEPGFVSVYNAITDHSDISISFVNGGTCSAISLANNSETIR